MKKSKEENPLVTVFIVPHCFLVGYKHSVEPSGNGHQIVDDHAYEDEVVDDEEFESLRKEWYAQRGSRC